MSSSSSVTSLSSSQTSSRGNSDIDQKKKNDKTNFTVKSNVEEKLNDTRIDLVNLEEKINHGKKAKVEKKQSRHNMREDSHEHKKNHTSHHKKEKYESDRYDRQHRSKNESKVNRKHRNKSDSNDKIKQSRSVKDNGDVHQIKKERKGGKYRRSQENSTDRDKFKKENVKKEVQNKRRRSKSISKSKKKVGIESPQLKIAANIKPNFESTGLLAQYAKNNVGGGCVLRFTEPLDAQIPPQFQKWKLFPFKGDHALPTIYLRGQSCFLVGRDMNISDIPLPNPSISAQHAVIQFRQRSKVEDNQLIPQIKPYIMDLDTTNGTFLNGQRIEGARYYELIDKDILRFGASQRDFVLMLDQSKD